ncbi:sigma-70 family RNA polymerase sigma factor [Alicyclobacillus cellulosilyticus]|uniref:sigma-70 family RNA polymerase sigma factor n=1 Tax=Alicyclobacillus cellulosilyticus TaxID=1003997 RepID=UPI001E5A5A85|nr:sigma-70 family RNA polymerase sigma factor [Alicyclobacillus cellulosilyticus]
MEKVMDLAEARSARRFKSNQVPPELDALSDEALVAAAQAGDAEALSCMFARYRDFICSKARMYFLAGANFEDLVQEAMIGFYESIRDYRPGRLPFRSFARLCITRQIIEAVKVFSSRKHAPLNDALSLDAPLCHDPEDERTLMDVVYDTRMPTPEDAVLIHDPRAAAWTDVADLCVWLEQSMDGMLTELERRVLKLFVEGYSYIEIAQQLGRTKKSVDNALQRIKRKLLACLYDEPSAGGRHAAVQGG